MRMQEVTTTTERAYEIWWRDEYSGHIYRDPNHTLMSVANAQHMAEHLTKRHGKEYFVMVVTYTREPL